MAEPPTVDQFRRYLQEEIVKATMIANSAEQQKRLWQLESALAQAIKFADEVKKREDNKQTVFTEGASVRVLSTSKPTAAMIHHSENCPKCDSFLAEDISFCPSCGHEPNEQKKS